MISCLAAGRQLIVALLLVGLAPGCAANKPYTIYLMPAPDVYEDGQVDPFLDSEYVDAKPDHNILYATDRQPTAADAKPKYYDYDRGHVLRLGSAEVELGIGDITWEEARRISLLKNRTENYPLKVVGVEEFGVLGASLTPFSEPSLVDEMAGERFATLVNDRLARSRVPDIYIYVHGFKVNFENPILVASELWHFLGYNGAFIAYSWPATPSNLAYAADTETADYAARNLRALLIYLADHTDAERIHIIGYSAGTRVVTRALQDITLYAYEIPAEEVHDRLKLGTVVMVGSDVDLDKFAGFLADGFAKVTRRLSVYLSGEDKALGMSRWFFRHRRLGQMVSDPSQVSGHVAEFFEVNPGISIIDVTDAEHATTGNGHAYFRKSPWVSSDILMTLMYGLAPEERGLVRYEEAPMFKFPSDYIDRLREALSNVNTELAASPSESSEAP